MRYLVPRAGRAPALLLVPLLLLSAACGTTRALRRAQDSFNDAATADMQLRTAPEETTAALLGVRNGGYRMTVGIIEGFSAVERAELGRHKLWGNALMLKAMSQWRLGEYDEAGKTADEAIERFADQLGPRDEAVLGALSGLIALDQAYAKLAPPCDFRDVDALVRDGLAAIESKRAVLSAGEPVQRYLIQAKLAGHRTRVQAEADCENSQTLPANAEAAKRDLCAFHKAGGDPEAFVAWRDRLGVDLTRDGCP